MSGETPKRYTLRVSPRARQELEAHLQHILEVAGEETGRAWYDGMLAAIGTLSENPRRRAVIPEQDRFRTEIRQISYRRTPHGPAWRVLFTITEGSEDAPTVNLLHIRHGAQKPITCTEARKIEGR